MMAWYVISDVDYGYAYLLGAAEHAYVLGAAEHAYLLGALLPPSTSTFHFELRLRASGLGHPTQRVMTTTLHRG